MKKEILLSLALMGSIGIITSFIDFSTADLSPKNDMEITKIGEMSDKRAAHQATLLSSGQVLITGGCAGHSCEKILRSAEVYDPASQSFRSVSPMNTPRASHTAVALPDGRVFVAGGWSGTQALASVEVYDPKTDEWAFLGTMNENRASLNAIALADSTVLIMGGGSGRLPNLMTIEIFDSATSTFTEAGKTTVNYYLATTMADERILMTGGQDKNGIIHDRAAIFDPGTRKVQQTGSMKTPRVKHAAALLDDGRVLVIGGSNSRGYRGRYNSTEIYDPETGEFSAGPDMLFGRHKINNAVTVLPTGTVLVAGGAEKLEIFDPADQIFRTMDGQLSGPQMFATATLLKNGDVLVLGGYDDRIESSASAWLVKIDEN